MKPNSDNLSHKALARLKQSIYQSFNIGELQGLCFELGMEFEDLAGSTRDTKSQELVLFFSRRGELGKLVSYLKKVRPSYNWEEILGTPVHVTDISSVFGTQQDLSISPPVVNNITNFINTGGGSVIGGSVTTGSDFIGRDKKESESSAEDSNK